ncbi:MAG: hypothetical protein U0174_06680 [Polyangiaceae bacterium]
MLPPFIIEQIRKREQAERTEESQPRLELPLPAQITPPLSTTEDPSEKNRGVLILDI